MPRVRSLSSGTILLVVLVALLAVPPAQAASRTFKFYAMQSRSTVPVRWNPCAPVTYRINTNGLAGGAAVKRMQQAVSEASAASGIRFRYVGRTTFVPDSLANPVPKSVGADVVITWAYAGAGARRSALLRYVPRLAGVGGFGAVSSEQGFRVARTGYVVLDAAHVFRMSPRKQYVVALHELGHVLGLDDVRDGSQVMNNVVLGRGPAHYAAGDRLGLRRLGRAAGCLTPAPAPARPTVQRSGTRLRIATRQVRSASGPVAYTLSSPELGGQVLRNTTPQFTIPLADLARGGRAGRTVRFQVRAANRVGAAASRPVAYVVPTAALTVDPSIVVTRSGLDVVTPEAVLAGTTIDVSDQLRVTTSGTVTARSARGAVSRSELVEHLIYANGNIASFEVTGTVRVEGPGLDRTFDVSGTYLTPVPPVPPAPPAPPLPPAPPVESPTDQPTDGPSATPTDAPSDEPGDAPTEPEPAPAPTDDVPAKPEDTPTGGES